jgi:hypothetical protein
MTRTDLHDDARELAWLAEHRPHPIAPDETTTLRARALLLEDIADAPRRPSRAARAVPPAPVPGSRRVRERFPRLAVGAVAAGGIALGVLLATGGPDVTTTGSGGGRASHLRLGGGVPAAAAAPLVRLSDRLHAKAAQAPAPVTGDATLIIRHQRYPDGEPVEGADLFTDDGTYYYAPTRAGLAAQIAAEQADTNPADDWTWIKRDADAAAAAFDGPIEQARRRMADAALRPGTSDADAAPPASLLAGLPPAKAKAVAARMAAAKAKEAKKRKAAAAGAGDDDAPKPLAADVVLENHIWTNIMDALSAGAARPEVRAGALHLLASMSTVTVAKDREDGRDVLILTSSAFQDGYTERLTIDAATGLPIRFAGGDAGRRPAVTITYDVSRVTLADIANDR